MRISNPISFKCCYCTFRNRSLTLDHKCVCHTHKCQSVKRVKLNARLLLCLYFNDHAAGPSFARVSLDLYICAVVHLSR